MYKPKTKDLIVIALMTALEVIFTRFLSINTPILRLGFGFLPVSMLGILYGPVWSGLAYAAGDLLGMLIFPTGPYFPGFTLTAFLTGLTFGIFLHNREITWKRVLPASLVIVIGLNLFLDTLWLHILMGQGFLALLPTRIFKCAVALPVQVILIPLVWNKIMKKVMHRA